MQRVRVLIADSEMDQRRQLRELLTGFGWRVLGETETGTQLLSLVRSTRPDVVILEMGLAAGEGSLFGIAEQVAAERVAVVLSGRSQTNPGAPVDLAALSSAHIQGMLRKPWQADEIGTTVAIAAGRFQQLLALEEQVRSLNEQMEARRMVGRAKTLLMERHNLTEQEAFRRIQAQSAALDKPVHEIARAIVTASEIPTA